MRRLHILVIDDEDDPRLIWFRQTLGDMGHRVHTAQTADAALDLFREFQFDLAFFDHDLGGRYGGSDIASRVLNDPDTYQCPKSVWVHSMNTQGAQNIASKFRSAGIPVIVEWFMDLQDKSDLQGLLESWVP
jgi:CheY-like chemotaxis protein